MNDLTPITHNYLLCIQIKCYCDRSGNKYLDRLWFKDLKEHLPYLKKFTLACPFQYGEPPSDTVPLDSDDLFSHIDFVELPSPNNLPEALIFLPVTIAKFWQAIEKANIVHSCVGGWPISWDWFITPIVQFHRKFYVIIVESAPWRLQSGIPASIPSKIRAYIYDKLARWSVNKADVAIFTQEEYRQTLLTNPQKQGYIIHASWIDEVNIISDTDARKIWRKKISPATKKLKILFAGRLVASKGILVLLEAMKALDGDEIPVKLNILGEGELFNECKKLRNNLSGTTQIQTLGTVPYGAKFFNLLQDYHAIVIPSISDEQPRIVYDAYSQAVSVLASNTPGLRDCIRNGETGMLVDANNPVALANLLKWAWQNLDQLEKMGLRSLEFARKMTHQEMHQQRWQILSEMIGTNEKLKNKFS